MILKFLVWERVNSLQNDKILDLSKSADDNQRWLEKCLLYNGNIVGKRCNAGYQHFLFFPTIFQKPFSRVIGTRDFVVKRLISGKKAFENVVRKGENAGHQHFLLFPQSFPCFQGQVPTFEIINLYSVITFSLDKFKMLSLSNQLNQGILFARHCLLRQSALIDYRWWLHPAPRVANTATAARPRIYTSYGGSETRTSILVHASQADH